jgi:ABC-2 type transport system permease protein
VTRAATLPGRPKLPAGQQALVTFLWIFCWIPLFPQGLLPLWMIVNGSGSKLWFLALHLSDPYRVPTAAAFVAGGLVMLYFGTVIPLRAGRAEAKQG